MLADIKEASVRPLAVAYMVVRATMTAADEMELRRELVEFAADHGYRLNGAFVERNQGRSMEAFAGMLDALQRGDVKYVIVPQLDHLGLLPGVRKAMKQWLEREAGVVVLAIHGEPVVADGAAAVATVPAWRVQEDDLSPSGARVVGVLRDVSRGRVRLSLSSGRDLDLTGDHPVSLLVRRSAVVPVDR